MYDSSLIASRIKLKLKEKKISASKMLADCNMNKDLLNTMQKGFFPRLENIAQIADYLNTSVDYLLGRTDEAEKKTAGITTDSPDFDTQKAIDYLNFIAEHDPEALQKAAEYARFLLQDKQ